MTRKFITTLLFISLCGGAQAQKFWSLHDCMEYAVANSPKNKIQDVNNDSRQREYRDAVLRFVPNIGAGVNASSNFGRGIDPETNTYTNTATFSNNYSLSGTMTLFNGFSTVNGLRIARIARLQGTEESQQIVDDIALQTIQAYYNVIYYLSMIKLAEEQLDQSQKNLHNTKVQEELGLKGNADVLQIEAQLASDDYNLIRQRNLHDDALLTLKQTMFYPIESELQVDTTVRLSVAPLAAKESPDSIFQMASTTLPELMLLKMEINAAKLRHRTSIWQLLPSFSASGGYSTGYYKAVGEDQTTPFRDQFRNRAGEYITVSMNIPLFGGLTRQSNITYQRNKLKVAEYQHVQKLQEVESEIKRAVQDMEGAAKSYVLSMKRVIAQETAHAATTRKFEEGLVSVLDLQVSANDLLIAKAERLNNLFTYMLKRRVVDYYKGIPYMNQE